jgi:hypothetical protein
VLFNEVDCHKAFEEGCLVIFAAESTGGVVETSIFNSIEIETISNV